MRHKFPILLCFLVVWQQYLFFLCIIAAIRHGCKKHSVFLPPAHACCKDIVADLPNLQVIHVVHTVCPACTCMSMMHTTRFVTAKDAASGCHSPTSIITLTATVRTWCSSQLHLSAASLKSVSGMLLLTLPCSAYDILCRTLHLQPLDCLHAYNPPNYSSSFIDIRHGTHFAVRTVQRQSCHDVPYYIY
jgi:hypothetical protein